MYERPFVIFDREVSVGRWVEAVLTAVWGENKGSKRRSTDVNYTPQKPKNNQSQVHKLIFSLFFNNMKKLTKIIENFLKLHFHNCEVSLNLRLYNHSYIYPFIYLVN
jgi:hypothetical protein